MGFLIGILILILFIVFCYFFIKRKLKLILGTGNIRKIMEEARLEDQEVPKSLSSMDSVYLEQIKKDFPDININELKRMVEKVVLDVYMAIEKKDSSGLSGDKIKSFANSLINDNMGKDIRYDNFKFHNTVVSKYQKSNGIATIYFGTNFEYIYKEYNKIDKKIQDRAKVEYIYVYDTSLVSDNKKTLGVNCPNCGSTIIDLGNKNCKYCGSLIVDIVKKVWICNDIVKY